MAQLDTEDREKMDKRKFAYVDKKGEGHLPINDESHVRNAMARFNQTDFESGAKKETARKKIVKAAVRPGDELRIARDGSVEIVPTGIPGVIDSLQRAIEDLKRKFFGP